MDIKGLRNLNLIGIIILCLFGLLFGYVVISSLFDYFTNPPSQLGYSTEQSIRYTTLLIIFLSIYILIPVLLYKFTVRGLDRGEYKSVKRWTFLGIFLGFFGGVIPPILFIVSYVSFEDAIRSQQNNHAHQNSYPRQIQARICNFCRRQIPNDSRLCPYCGRTQLRKTKDTRPPPSFKRGH
jgi:Na+/proline symporter